MAGAPWMWLLFLALAGAARVCSGVVAGVPWLWLVLLGGLGGEQCSITMLNLNNFFVRKTE